MFSLDIEIKGTERERRGASVMFCSICPFCFPLLCCYNFRLGSDWTQCRHILSHCTCLWTSLCFGSLLSLRDGFLFVFLPSPVSCFPPAAPVSFLCILSLSQAKSLRASYLSVTWLHSCSQLGWVLSFTSSTLNQYWFKYCLFFNYILNAVILISFT